MRVAVIGAGPAGLLFSLLAQRRYPSWRIEVAEQNPDSGLYSLTARWRFSSATSRNSRTSCRW